MDTSKVPDFSNKSVDGMSLWFATMSERGMLFHPDDPAEKIYDIATGKPTFSPTEFSKANAILETMFNRFGDQVYEAAYPIFMKYMGIRLDA